MKKWVTVAVSLILAWIGFFIMRISLGITEIGDNEWSWFISLFIGVSLVFSAGWFSCLAWIDRKRR